MSRDPDARCASCGVRLSRVDADHEDRCIAEADGWPPFEDDPILPENPLAFACRMSWLGMLLLGAAMLAWAVPRAVAAERHPGMTSDQPPGWRLYVAAPGEVPRPRGRFSDSLTSCLLDLHSDAIVQPKGTRLTCVRVDRDGTVRR